MSRATVTVPAVVLRFLATTVPWQEVEQGIPGGFLRSSWEDLELMRRLRHMKRDRRGAVRVSVRPHTTGEVLRYWAAVTADEAWSPRTRGEGADLIRRLDDALGVPPGRRYGL